MLRDPIQMKDDGSLWCKKGLNITCASQNLNRTLSNICLCVWSKWEQIILSLGESKLSYL